MSEEQVTLNSLILAEGEPVAKRRLEKPRHIPRKEGSVTTEGVDEVLGRGDEEGGAAGELMHRRLDRSEKQRRLWARFRAAAPEDELAGRLADAYEDPQWDRFELNSLWGMFTDDKPVLNERMDGLTSGE